LLAVLASPLSLLAQGTAPAADADKQTIQMLLQRIERLEARVEQLEGTQAAAGKMQTAGLAGQQASRPSSAPAAGPAEAPAPSTVARAPLSDPEQESEHLEPERMDMSKTLLRIRGFGDVNFHGSNRTGDANSFAVGQLNLFVTSDISEKFKFLGEIVFESGPDNFYNVPGGRRN
jgi:hypothetical protein